MLSAWLRAACRLFAISQQLRMERTEEPFLIFPLYQIIYRSLLFLLNLNSFHIFHSHIASHTHQYLETTRQVCYAAAPAAAAQDLSIVSRSPFHCTYIQSFLSAFLAGYVSSSDNLGRMITCQFV